LGADGSRVTVIPSGVDLSLFTHDAPAEPRRPGRRRLLYIGRLVERKGIGNIVSALPDLSGVELVVAGGPAREQLDNDSEARRLCALAEARGVADRVDLRGSVPHDELPHLIRSADAVVSVPWYEPFGIVPLEAMACGVPVVASAVGGLIDTVVDGVTGVHVPPRDPERLASAVASLLDDDARRQEYGRAGIERARRLYNWGRIGNATLEVYRELAGRRPAAASRRRSVSGGAFRDHLAALHASLERLEPSAERIEAWGEQLCEMLCGGHRLLVVGNGGSAAEAQHLTAELVGRYERERDPLSAICLHADTSSLTAIGNDYGAEQVFARQVRAHGRPGDVLLALSTSGRSPNVLAAVEAARGIGLSTWALTGQEPNPLAHAADEAVCVPAANASTVQELHLVAVHLLCDAVDRRMLGAATPALLTSWEAMS
jgi:type III pantothenate kinase